MGKQRGNRNLTPQQQQAIARGHQQGIRQTQLAEQFNVGKSTICKFLKRWKSQGGVEKQWKNGRHRMTSRLVDRNIIRMSRSNPRLTASDITRQISDPNSPLPSTRTVRRRLQEAGLNGRRPVKKPLISDKNRRARIAWAKDNLHWGRREWSRVLWSDESRFRLFGTDGITWVRRPTRTRFNPKYQLPTVKHGGGSCMVWGAFSASGVGPLHHVNYTMDRFKEENILENIMRTFARRTMGRAFVFHQDNDPKHSSKHVKEWFNRRRRDPPRLAQSVSRSEHHRTDVGGAGETSGGSTCEECRREVRPVGGGVEEDTAGFHRRPRRQHASPVPGGRRRQGLRNEVLGCPQPENYVGA